MRYEICCRSQELDSSSCAKGEDIQLHIHPQIHIPADERLWRYYRWMNVQSKAGVCEDIDEGMQCLGFIYERMIFYKQVLTILKQIFAISHNCIFRPPTIHS